METLRIRTKAKSEAVDITDRIQTVVKESRVREGLCLVYVAHTTAGVFINENADPAVTHDLLSTLERLVPWTADYEHAEGNAAAHVKATLTGSSQVIPIRSGKLALGRWQGVYLAEFDGPRERELLVTVMGGPAREKAAPKGTA
jgi:secondary thiamine-phosphate synthase enzyme